MEILYVSKMKMIQIFVYLPNGTFMKVYIESYTSFDELKILIMVKLGIKPVLGWRFGFMEQIEKSDKYEERFMEDHHSVLDIIASWDILKEQESEALRRARLIFMVKVIPPFFEKEENNIFNQIHISQFAYNMVLGKFLVTSTDLLKLSSLHLQMDFGDYNDSYALGFIKYPQILFNNLDQKSRTTSLGASLTRRTGERTLRSSGSSTEGSPGARPERNTTSMSKTGHISQPISSLQNTEIRILMRFREYQRRSSLLCRSKGCLSSRPTLWRSTWSMGLWR